MTVHACPTAEPLPVATRGHYIVQEPEPTPAELLNRIGYRLLESLPGPFNRRAELARNSAAQQVQRLETQARALERVALLDFPATDAFLRP